VPEQSAARQVPEPEVPERRPVPTARFMPLASVTLMLPASATRPDAVTTPLFEATWPLLIPIETDVPLGQAAFDEVIWTFQSPSNVEAADGDAKPSAATKSEAAIRDFDDVVMASPFGFDTNTISQRRAHDRDDHHKQKAPRSGGASFGLLAVLDVTHGSQLTRVQVWPPQNMPPKAHP
jgi:hypothetical protein